MLIAALSPGVGVAKTSRPLLSAASFTNLIDGSNDMSGTTCSFSATDATLVARCTIVQSPEHTHSGTDASSLQQGDYVAVALTVSTHPVRQYVFFLNPAGVQTAIGTAADAAGVAWKGSVVKSPASWSATFAIPFASLHLPSAGERDVRVGVVRADAESGAAWGWPHIGDQSPMNPAGEQRIPDPFPRS